MKKIIANLSLTAFSLLFFFLLLEFVVFRFIFLAPDLAPPAYVNGVVRYEAGASGVNRIKNEIEENFQINENGWNSRYTKYELKKDPDKFRVAVIGDSYIAAFQIDHNRSMSEKLEDRLGKNAEVYRFGIDGAPMSQYLHMLRHEVVKYQPDMVVVNIVHNDFNESYSFVSGVFRSSFLKYEIEDGKVSKEISPKIYKAPWYSIIREKSATWKYLAYRQHVDFGALRDLILGDDNDVEYRGNIDISSMEKDTKNNYIVTDYTFKQMKKICDEKGIKLVIMMDADDQRIYEIAETGKSTSDSIIVLNRIAEKAANANGIRFVSLQDSLSKDYKINKKKFGFINDGHWNEYTHGVVASILDKLIKTEIKPAALANNGS